MKNIRIYFGLAIFAFIACLPQNSSAYEVVEKNAVSINENTVLLAVTYKFGFLNRETYMSIGAERGLNSSSSAYVGYDILNQGKVYKDGQVNSLVLSGTKIRDGQYYLPEGKAGYFIMVALVTLPQGNEVSKEDLSLKINHLPFTMVKVKTGEKSKVYLSEEELKDFVSSKVK
jgi:hypothetical protein